MSKRILSYWIKERDNPQTGTYYVPLGQLSKRAAMRHENSLYGMNFVYPYATEADYKKELKRLKRKKLKVMDNEYSK